MDYKEKYEIALKHAKSLYNSMFVNNDILEQIFPELKESEDERLRKTTIAFLKEYADKGYENAVECIDWLEKQGEQKPIKASYTTIAETGNGGVNAVVKRELSTDECYCEQKSTNSKEDDVRRMSTIQVLEYARSIPDYDQFGKDDIDKNIAWLGKQGQCEQKIAWNEDDEEKYSRLNDFIYSTSYCDSRKEFSDWLKSLKERIQSKQGEQKEYTFTSLSRLLDMIEPTSKAKEYCQKLIDTLEKEGYFFDAKIVGDRLKIMNGEEVPMATMDEIQGEKKVRY